MCPRLLEIGPFTLHSFGTMVILGFLLGMFLAAWLARTRGLPGEDRTRGATAAIEGSPSTSSNRSTHVQPEGPGAPFPG